MDESSALKTYENKVIESVDGNDMKAFRLNIAKLRIFYSSGLESEKKYLMYGLHLMHLLAINDLPLFHLGSYSTFIIKENSAMQIIFA